MDKSIQEALKWIYASLGGDITKLAAVDDITAILNAIAALDTVQKISGAKELPDVTADDNGDVLTVVEGAWTNAAPVPSGGIFTVNFTMGASGEEADKTYAEIEAAAAQGMAVAFCLPSGQAIAFATKSANVWGAYFTVPVISDNTLTAIIGALVMYAADGTITMQMGQHIFSQG